MTVAELIEQLQKIPGDVKVILVDADTNWYFKDPLTMWEEGDKVMTIESGECYGGDYFGDWKEVIAEYNK